MTSDLQVAAGDTVSVVIAAGATYWNDSTELDFTATLTTPPSCDRIFSTITAPLPKTSVKSGSTVSIPSPASTSNADTRGQLRWADTQYIHNLSTDGLAAGTCTVHPTGGATATSTFTITK